MQYLVLDVETTISNDGNPFDEKNKLCYVGIRKDGVNYNFPIEYDDSPYGGSLASIQSLIDSVDTIVGFNIKFDIHWIRKYGINIHSRRVWDCQLSHFILSGQREPYPSLNGVAASHLLDSKLDVVASEYWNNGIDTPDIPKEILVPYLEKDLELTEQVYLKQLEVLEKNPQYTRLISLHNQDLVVLQEMEFNGLLYNEKDSEAFAEQLEEEMRVIDSELNHLVNCDDFNFNSVDHVSAFLYGGSINLRRKVPAGFYKTGPKAGEPKEKWEVYQVTFEQIVKPLKGSELSKEGLYSTDEDTLRSLKGSKRAKEIIEMLLKRSELEKRVSTYYRGIPKIISKFNWKQGVLHGQLNQCVARTGRLSSSRPNLQNFDGECKQLFYSRFA